MTFVIAIPLILICFGLLFEQFMNQELILFGLGIVLSIAIAVLIQYIVFREAIGSFNAKLVVQDNINFLSVFSSKKNWKYISKATASYSIIENVVDDRGTSSTTSTATLYHSPKQTISRKSKQEEILFAYPINKVVLPTLSIGGVSIKWMLHLRLTTIVGFKLYFSRVFIVKNVD